MWERWGHLIFESLQKVAIFFCDHGIPVDCNVKYTKVLILTNTTFTMRNCKTLTF